MAARTALAVGVLLCLAGCAGEAEPPAGAEAPAADSAQAARPAVNPFAEPARRALRIELDLDRYRRVEGSWAAGNATSTFAAYFAGDTLRLIEEQMDRGDGGTGTNVYYFEDEAPFYAVQEAIRPLPDAADAGQHDRVELRLALAPGGDVLASEERVNGPPRPISEATLRDIRLHAAALHEQARAGLAESRRSAL